MRIAKANKIGTQVMDKITGKNYQIISEMTENTAAKAQEIDAEGNLIPEEEATFVEISEKNDICFRVTKWVKDTSIPEGYYANGGILYHNDKPVTEQGQIKVMSVIAAQPGYLIIAVAPKSGIADLWDIYSYSPSRDMFKPLVRDIPVFVEIIKEIDDAAIILSYSKTKTEETVDENGEKANKTVLDRAGFILIENETVAQVTMSHPIDIDKEIISLEDNNGSVWLFAPCTLNSECEETDLYYEQVIVNKTDFTLDSYGTVKFAGELNSVTVCQLDKELVFMGDNFISHTGVNIEDDIVKEVKDYPYLIDVNRSIDYETTLTFADKEYRTKSLTRKSTKDRGYIFSVK